MSGSQSSARVGQPWQCRGCMPDVASVVVCWWYCIRGGCRKWCCHCHCMCGILELLHMLTSRVIVVIVTHVVIIAFVASLLIGTRSCHSHQHQGLAAGDDSLSCEDDLRPHRHKAIGVPFDNPHSCRTMALPQPCQDPGRHRQLRHLPPGRPRNITVRGANLRLEDDIVDLGCARHDPTYPMATLRNWHSTPNPDTGDHQTLHHPTIVLWNIPSTTAYLAFEHHTTPQYTTKNMTLFRVNAKGWPGTSSCSW